MTSQSTPIRVLIVDDEPSARELLREMLVERVLSGEVEIIGECDNGPEAVEKIRALKPDLVLLDIQMPEVNGFDVLSELRSDLPLIIFVTAYDEYAVRAFEVHALDYLLKPFDRERFEMAFGRLKRLITLERTSDLGEPILSMLEERDTRESAFFSEHPSRCLERLIVRTDGRVFFLKANEIEWIGAEGNYVSLHVGQKCYLFRQTISTLEAQLDQRKFRRIHRSTIVNIDYIKELHPMFRGEYRVVMRDGTELKLSHSYRDRLQQHKIMHSRGKDGIELTG
jgi:two-component system LytT family response regulator